MKRILCSHTDLDGIGSIVLAETFQKYVFFDDILILDYGFEEDEEVMTYISHFDEIVIADLTLPEEKLKVWKNSKIQIFDHHSQTDWIKNYSGSVWDDLRCGTRIFWEEYLKPKIGRYPVIIDQFVNLVDVYDLWKQDSPFWEEAKNLNSVLYGIKNYGQKDQYNMVLPFVSLMLQKFEKLSEWRWTKKENYLIEKSNKREQDMLNQALNIISYRTDSKGFQFGVTMIPSKISLVASKILEQQDFLDYLIVINSYRGVTGKLSFRSRNGFNCNDIYIANGHDAAAGAGLLPEQAKVFWENKNLSFKYNDQYTDMFDNIFMEDGKDY